MEQTRTNRMLFVLMSFVLIAIVSAQNSESGLRIGVTGKVADGEGHIKGSASLNQQSRVRSVNEIENEFQNNNESNSTLNDSLGEIDRSAGADAKASGFAQVSHGTGWAISSDNQGSFAQITIVEKSFVNVTDNSNSVTDNSTNSTDNNSTNSTNETTTNQTNSVSTSSEFSIGTGVLKLTGMPAFNLRMTSATEDTFTFDVVGSNPGTLTLTREESLSGFSVWSGTLDLDSGTSYELHIATLDSKVKGEALGAGKGNGQNIGAKLQASAGKSHGFWARLRAFFGFGDNSNSDNSTNTSSNDTNSS